VVETLGPETYVYMDASGLPICARVDRSQRMAPGDQVRLHVAPGAIHLFDTSGRRLAA
jgi:ABC-type sugar transport system ATPase subunit